MTTDALLPLAGAGLLALSVSFGLTRWLADRAGSTLGPLDHPNARSLHHTPVPRSGGLGVLAGVALVWLSAWLWGEPSAELLWIGAALLVVAVVSFLDDLGHLPALVRLAAHGLAALLLISGGLRWTQLDLPGLFWAMPTALALVLTLLFVVWMINLYNFMDGMDGLAGGMAVCGFLTLAWLGWRGDEPLYALICLGVAAAAAGFLVSNLPPARIFLGDVGSSSLGLLVAALTLWGVTLGLFTLWVAWLIFSPFIVDATWTLLARLARGERVWEAHRSHHYQRVILAGWTHRETLARAYALMGAVSVCAVSVPRLTVIEQWALLAGWALVYGLIHAKVMRLERKRG